MTAPHSIPLAARAFDSIASDYDQLFSNTLIGRAQRQAVQSVAKEVFRPGQRILEINCGTGEDALFLAKLGMTVVACDASAKMVELAARKLPCDRHLKVEFRQLPIEGLHRLNPQQFQGVFSNFSGLNCVADLRSTARTLFELTAAGSRALICLSTRFCIWETAYYLLRFDKRAFRRLPGLTIASLGARPIPVYYPTVRQIRKRFSPWFRLRNIQGIGVLVPPSYVEDWAQGHRRAFRWLQAMDRISSRVPLLRALGDHVLLDLERTPS